MQIAPNMPPEKVIIVNLSGRGDKDLGIVFSELEKEKRPEKETR